MNSLPVDFEAWVMPDGLDRSAPRNVRLTGSGRTVMALAIVFLAASVVAVVGLGLVASRQALRACQLREQGVVIDAVVSATWWRKQGKSTRYWVDYSFAVDGRTYSGRGTLSRREWQLLHKGSTVRVRYLASDPEGSEWPNGSGDEMPVWVPPLVGVGFAVSGLAMIAWVRRQRRLLAEGRPAPGIVTGHGRVRRSSHGRELGKQYYYRFRLLSGALGEGKAGPLENPPAIGALITIIYENDNPRRNTPYPLSLVRIE